MVIFLVPQIAALMLTSIADGRRLTNRFQNLRIKLSGDIICIHFCKMELICFFCCCCSSSSPPVPPLLLLNVDVILNKEKVRWRSDVVNKYKIINLIRTFSPIGSCVHVPDL